MKKKILLGIIISFLFMGVASAAALWGSYKGNAKVNVVISGESYTTTGVPPIIYNGQVMLPLNILKWANVDYVWDSKNQVVSITPKQTQQVIQTNSFNPTQRTNEIIALGGGGVTITNISNDSTSIVLFPPKSNINSDWNTVFDVFVKLVDFGSTYSRVVYGSGQSQIIYEIKTQDLKDFLNGFITKEQLKKLWIVTGSNPTPAISGSGSTTSSAITSKIDGDFEGYDNGKIFKLLNGQIWQQTDYHYHYTYKYSPEVTIYQDGSQWYMIVDGVDGKVTVEKLK